MDEEVGKQGDRAMEVRFAWLGEGLRICFGEEIHLIGLRSSLPRSSESQLLTPHPPIFSSLHSPTFSRISSSSEKSTSAASRPIAR